MSEERYLFNTQLGMRFRYDERMLANPKVIVIDKDGMPVERPDGSKPALQDLHWTQLKKLVEAKGGQFKAKAQAIAFLESERDFP